MWTQVDDALTLEMVDYLSKGDVAVTIRNLVEEAQAAGQNATWDAVKDRLTELYLDDDERGYRRELVDNLRQTPYQDTSEYGRKFSTAVQKAYTAPELLVPLVLQRVIKTFISSLRDKHVRTQVHLDRPATLAAAVQDADAASRAISRAEVEGRTEEPMEVGALTAKAQQTFEDEVLKTLKGLQGQCTGLQKQIHKLEKE